MELIEVGDGPCAGKVIEFNVNGSILRCSTIGGSVCGDICQVQGYVREVGVDGRSSGDGTPKVFGSGSTVGYQYPIVIGFSESGDGRDAIGGVGNGDGRVVVSSC